MAAVSWVALTNVVVRLEPFHWMLDPETKPAPAAVSVKDAPPAAVEFGVSEVSEGDEPFPAGLMANASEPDTEAAEFATTIFAFPDAWIRLAGTSAVSCVAFTNVVVRFVPFHLTVAPETKPVPVAVMVNAAPPAVAELGARLLSAGEMRRPNRPV